MTFCQRISSYEYCSHQGLLIIQGNGDTYSKRRCCCRAKVKAGIFCIQFSYKKTLKLTFVIMQLSKNEYLQHNLAQKYFVYQ